MKKKCYQLEIRLFSHFFQVWGNHFRKYFCKQNFISHFVNNDCLRARPLNLWINGVFWLKGTSWHIWGSKARRPIRGKKIFVILSGWWRNRVVSFSRVSFSLRISSSALIGSNIYLWRIQMFFYLSKSQTHWRDFSNVKILFTTLETSLDSIFPPNDGGVIKSSCTNHSQADSN